MIHPMHQNQDSLRSGKRRRQGCRAGKYFPALCIVLAALAVLMPTVVALPDLQVTFVQVNTGGATAGTVFMKTINPVSITVRNGGTDPSTAGVLSLTSSDGFSGTGTFPALSAGSTTTIRINDTVLRSSSGYNITYTATADPGNLISESNETNNAYTTKDRPVHFNGYKGKALFSDNGGNITTSRSFDLRGGIVHSFGNSYYRSGSFSGGWTTYDVQWKYNPANASNPESFELAVPPNATVHYARLFLPYTWDLGGNATFSYDMPDNVSVQFNGNTIHYDSWTWDRGNFGEWGPYTYGLMTYDVTSLYQKNATNTLHFTRPGYMDKLSLYGMTLAIVYDNPAETRKQIFINEGFDLLGADYTNYKTPESEAIAYVEFTGPGIDTTQVKTVNLTTFVPSGDSWEGNLYVNGALVAEDVWNYGADGQPVGENGYPQVAVDQRDIKANAATAGNVIGIQSTAWASQPCMAASQQFLVAEYPDAPVAGFAADTVTPAVGQTVTFTDQTANDPTGWAWTFGDGGTSTVQNPSHAYTEAGIYSVALTATNAAGSNTVTKTDYITVGGITVLPLPGYSGSPTDPDSDGFYEDLNSNGRKDLNDVQLMRKYMSWIAANEPLALFDMNGNGRMDLNDVQLLRGEI